MQFWSFHPRVRVGSEAGIYLRKSVGISPRRMFSRKLSGVRGCGSFCLLFAPLRLCVRLYVFGLWVLLL
jgi:hypothetical protein